MRRRRMAFGCVLAAVALVGLGRLPSVAAAPGQPGRYVVVLDDTVADPAAVARRHAAEHAAVVGFVYEHALKGYSATVPSARLEALARDPRVRYVEPDSEMTAVGQTLPWGVDRVGAGVSSTRAGDGSGAVAADVYVIDTGVDTAHTDLHVATHINFGPGPNRDCNGHGTHVAGTAAARDNASDVVGVAPAARIHAVKVLGCNGSGPTSGTLKGVDWVTANAAASGVANMSLGGPATQALDDAVRRSAARGIVYALAAGNNGRNACDYSPARAGQGDNGVVTVAATQGLDDEASFSNFGPCVDTWAPGVGTLSTQLGGGTTTMSGTSMASPLVAGGMALLRSGGVPMSPVDVERDLKAKATTLDPSNPPLSKDDRPIARLDVRSY